MAAEGGVPAFAGWSRRKLAMLFATATVMLVVAQFFYIFQPLESDLSLRLAYEEVAQHEQPGTGKKHESFVKPALPERLARGGFRPLMVVDSMLLGQPARRVLLADEQGRPASLFIMEMAERFAPLDNTFQQRGPWLVSHWREGEQFFSLVAQP